MRHIPGAGPLTLKNRYTGRQKQKTVHENYAAEIRNPNISERRLSDLETLDDCPARHAGQPRTRLEVAADWTSTSGS